MHNPSCWWSVQISCMGWFVRKRRISTMLEICCSFGRELFCKRVVQHSSIWNPTVVLTLFWKKGVTPSSLGAFSECECEVFCKRGVHPFIKTVNSRVPLFHYFAVNLHNRLNCLEDGISMSRAPFSYSMAYGNLMAVTLIETDQNSFLSPL